MKEEVVYRNHGFDESNNYKSDYKYPMVYVRVSSNELEDIEQRKEKKDFFSKPRSNHKSIAEKLESRNYSFLLLNNLEEAILPKHKGIGIILASLIYGEKIKDYLNIYLDGEWNVETLDFTEGILSDVTGLEKGAIKIYTGKDLDRRVGLVNIADEAAHWLLGRRLRTLKRDPYRKEILFKEFKEFF